jgi:hypothetical protein
MHETQDVYVICVFVFWKTVHHMQGYSLTRIYLPHPCSATHKFKTNLWIVATIGLLIKCIFDTYNSSCLRFNFITLFNSLWKRSLLEESLVRNTRLMDHARHLWSWIKCVKWDKFIISGIVFSICVNLQSDSILTRVQHHTL